MDYFNDSNTNIPNYSNPSNQQRQSPDTADTTPSLLSPSHNLVSASPAAPTASNNANTSTGPAPRIRRRNRMITSCLECRRRKLKCNKSQPCSNCLKFARDCVFLAPALDQASQLKLTEIKEKVGSLERLLERDVAKHSNHFSSNQRMALPDDADDNLPPNEDEKDLEPSPLASVDAAYEVDGDDDDLLDLGIQMGKMRITERIGGFFRPKISQELEHAIKDPYVWGKQDDSIGIHTLPPAQEWLKPGLAYIAPSSGFFFGQTGQPASLIDFLPSRLAADRLVKQFFIAVYPIAQILHRPSFEKEYDTFWDEVSLGIEPPNPVQAMVFAVMFAGVVSMDPSDVIRDFGVAKPSLIDNFKLGTETALGRANFLRTTKIETLQAFVLYLIPLCRAEVSRAHSVLVGAAIRMAECMGLHRDGEFYGLSPLETHVRRLIWHQLCFLDIRTCEAQGPRPTIRRDDFDTKLPLNVDDIDLHATGKPPQTADRWTDATFSIIRFEINEMYRIIWVDRPRIQMRKISLTAVLSKVETFRQNMTKYDKFMDDRVPIQKCAKLVKSVLLSRMHVMLLHSYHSSTHYRMPDRLRNIMITSGLHSMESAIALETTPALHNWEWYGGAFQQYHTAFLLLMEVYVHPQRKEANQIWSCLDYVFECDSYLPRLTKARKILSELQQKTAVYQSMRGMRAPVTMNNLVGQRPPKPTSEEGRATGPIPNPEPYLLGKMPLSDSDAILSSVSNNEHVGTYPTGRTSEVSSPASTMGQQIVSQSPSVNDDIMADIDWDAFDALFPPDQQSELDVHSFSFSNTGIGL
ncbi:hypothetical protein BCON_0162g00150 [Botryotinia convoluta]|uniref:Zn(2)-C6 fungal-type domain-containing protein n=1 Tax=Botryotinia convoluta TaxID=54673 RepID=A0A4Z1I337_9HELO|nr:hypothetical protein BCON_0162g00150 [Botryotinia convoluta]